MGHHGARADNRFAPDGHPFEDHSVGADKSMIPNPDRFGNRDIQSSLSPFFIVQGVGIGIHYLHTAPKKHMAADTHPFRAENGYTGHSHIIADFQLTGGDAENSLRVTPHTGVRAFFGVDKDVFPNGNAAPAVNLHQAVNANGFIKMDLFAPKGNQVPHSFP